MEIEYSCLRSGWGFASTGTTKLTSTCQSNKLWSVTKVDDCVALPCEKTPPELPVGGWTWYEFDFSRYKCPNGFGFADGSYPYWFSECGADKNWLPDEVDECVPR